MNWSKNLLIGVSLLGGGLLGWLIGYQPLIAATLLLGIGIVFVVVVKPQLLLPAALLSLAGGQILRIPPLRAGGPLLADLLLAALLVVWIIQLFGQKRLKLEFSAQRVWLAFLAIALLALLATPLYLSSGDLLTAFLYWLRLLVYASIIWLVPAYVSSSKDQRGLLKTFAITASLVVAIGFAQFILFPNISALSKFGWDPHVGRFVSTFLDPNYLGGFLALFLAYLFAQNEVQPRWWRWLFIALVTLAAVLTFSRSGYIALVVVLALAAFRLSWKLLLVAAIILIPLGFSIPRVAERIQGAFRIDATAQDRVQSWVRGEQVFDIAPLFGVGYNAYEFGEQSLGLAPKGAVSHASGGSDSSLLNVAATTGILGFTLFVLGGLLVWLNAIRLSYSSNKYQRIAALTLFVGIPAVFANAFFVNALFYPFTIIPLLFLVGLMYAGGASESD